jgi:hypothetical protein
MRRSRAFRMKNARFALRRGRSDFERAPLFYYFICSECPLCDRGKGGFGYLPDYFLLASTRLVRSGSGNLIPPYM